jgi:predicted acetyltransferase
LLLDDAVARDEPVAMLTASEGGIYGRFGFGISMRAASLTIDTREAAFAGARPAGQLRMLDLEATRKIEPEIFDRARRARPGGVSRPAAWWPAEQFDSDFGTRFDVVYEAPGGRVDGFACYGIKDHWTPGRGADNRIRATDVVALTPDAEHALWRHLCEVDLVRTVGAWHTPPDIALPWMLESARAVQVSLGDFVWTRVLDVPAALGERSYSTDGRVAIEVHDPFRPDGAASGTFTIDGGDVTAGGTPDLSCDVRVLSAAWLGDVRWSTLQAAGLVDEHTPGSVATADAMFASTPLPYAYTWF